VASLWRRTAHHAGERSLGPSQLASSEGARGVGASPSLLRAYASSERPRGQRSRGSRGRAVALGGLGSLGLGFGWFLYIPGLYRAITK
jgi:hypothetical protein